MRTAITILMTAYFVLAPVSGALAVTTTQWGESGSNPTYSPGKAYYPTILREESGTYTMWSDGPTSLQMSTSTDGVTWTAPVSASSGLTNVRHAVVERIGTQYRIWYWDSAQLYTINAIRTAVSTDGLTWTGDQPLTQVGTTVVGADQAWRRGSYGPSDILYNAAGSETIVDPVDEASVWANKFVMYYDATTGGAEATGLAVSNDGVNWSGFNGGAAAVLAGSGTGWDTDYASRCTVIRENDDAFHMWYSGGTGRLDHGIGYAFSTDGIVWTKDASNPIFHKDDGAAWRADRTYTPMVVGDQMWFTGKDVAGTYAIGYAIPANKLSLNATLPSLFVKPGESVILDMDVENLQQLVNGCQALIGYSSTYLIAGSAAPGGGPWTELIYESWATPGELDTAIGVTLDGGPVGTDADGTVAVITLTAGTTEGSTQVVFRPDGDNGYATMFSDLNANPVWPAKYNSQIIVVDGTPPIISVNSAKQGGTELLIENGSATNAVQGAVDIHVGASDAPAGLSGHPSVTVTPNGGSAEAATFVNESPTGTFNYTWTVQSTTPNGIAAINASVSDNAGNSQSATAKTFTINKTQVTGTVSFSTLSNTAYSVTRDVVFKATDFGGTVLKTWTVSVTFTNSAQVASGSYTVTDVPSGTVNLSAKTAWHLRKRQAVTFDGDGQATSSFTLLGGDIKDDNFVNILDYSVMKNNWNTTNTVADVNGDGLVQLLDYSLMKSNWFKPGDPQ